MQQLSPIIRATISVNKTSAHLVLRGEPMFVFTQESANWRLLHKGESLCCFRDSASVTYGGMLPSDLTLSALRFILYAKSGQSCKQDCETVDFCNSLN